MAFLGAITSRIGDFAEATRVLAANRYIVAKHLLENVETGVESIGKHVYKLGSYPEDRATTDLLETTASKVQPALEEHLGRIQQIQSPFLEQRATYPEFVKMSQQINTSLDQRFARQLGQRKVPSIEDFLHFHGHISRSDHQIARETIGPLIEEYPDVAKQMSGVHLYGTGVAKYGKLSAVGGLSRRKALRHGLGVSYAHSLGFVTDQPINRIDIALPNLKRDYPRVGIGIGQRRIEEAGNASTLLHDTLIHEFGHQIHNTANRGLGLGEMGRLPQFVETLLEEKVPGYTGTLDDLKEWGEKNLSPYAVSNDSEFMAEVFTHHKLYGNNPLVNEIAETTKGLTRLRLPSPAPTSFYSRQLQLPLPAQDWYKASSRYSVRNRAERPSHWITGTAKRKAWTGDQLAFPVIPRPNESRIAARTQAHVAGLSSVAF